MCCMSLEKVSSDNSKKSKTVGKRLNFFWNFSETNIFSINRVFLNTDLVSSSVGKSLRIPFGILADP